jgi:nucleoside-diphosphate-sugar epimerase
MKVLVTGGSGFIGSRLVRRLLADGHDVRILDRELNSDFEQITVQGDVADPDAVSRALAEVDLVYHLAAEYRDDVRPIERYYHTNVEGTRVLCEGLSKFNIRSLVFTSSVAVYGFNMRDLGEDSPREPKNHYGVSKSRGEDLVEAWRRADPGRLAMVMRPCVVFGPGNRGNVYTLLRQILSHRFVMIGDGRNRKSMAYVENVVEALVYLSQLQQSVLVNYADKPDFNMADLLAAVRGITGTSIPRLRLPQWLGTIAGTATDGLSRMSGRQFPITRERITKFCATSTVSVDRLRALGFVPSRTLQEGLEVTIRSEFMNESPASADNARQVRP